MSETSERYKRFLEERAGTAPKPTPAVPTQGQDAGMAATPVPKDPSQKYLDEKGFFEKAKDVATSVISADVPALLGYNPGQVVEDVTGSEFLGDIGEKVYQTSRMLSPGSAVRFIADVPYVERESKDKPKVDIEEQRRSTDAMLLKAREKLGQNMVIDTISVGGKKGFNLIPARRSLTKKHAERALKEWTAANPDRDLDDEAIQTISKKVKALTDQDIFELKSVGSGVTFVDLDSDATTDALMEIPDVLAPLRVVAATVLPKSYSVSTGVETENEWMDRSIPAYVLETMFKMISPSVKIGAGLASGLAEASEARNKGDEFGVVDALVANLKGMSGLSREGIEAIRSGETAFDQSYDVQKNFPKGIASILNDAGMPISKETAETMGNAASWAWLGTNLYLDVKSPEVAVAQGTGKMLRTLGDSKAIKSVMQTADEAVGAFKGAQTIDDLKQPAKSAAPTASSWFARNLLNETVNNNLKPHVLKYKEGMQALNPKRAGKPPSQVVGRTEAGRVTRAAKKILTDPAASPEKKKVAQTFIDAQSGVIDDTITFFQDSFRKFPERFKQARELSAKGNAAQNLAKGAPNDVLNKRGLTQALEDFYGKDYVDEMFAQGHNLKTLLDNTPDGAALTRPAKVHFEHALKQLDDGYFEFRTMTGKNSPAAMLLNDIKNSAQRPDGFMKTFGEKYLASIGRMEQQFKPFRGTGAVAPSVQDAIRRVRAGYAKNTEEMVTFLRTLEKLPKEEIVSKIDQFLDSSGYFAKFAKNLTETLDAAKGGESVSDPMLNAIARIVIDTNKLRGATAEAPEILRKTRNALRVAAKGEMTFEDFIRTVAGPQSKAVTDGRARILAMRIFAMEKAMDEGVLAWAGDTGMFLSPEDAQAAVDVFRTGFTKGNYSKAVETLNRLGMPPTQQYIATARNVSDVAQAEKFLATYKGTVLPKAAYDTMYRGLGDLTKNLNTYNIENAGPVATLVKEASTKLAQLWRTSALVGVISPNPRYWVNQQSDAFAGVWATRGLQEGLQTVQRSIIANTPFFSSNIPIVNKSLKYYAEHVSKKYGNTPYLMPFVNAVVDPVAFALLNGRQGLLRVGGKDYDLDLLRKIANDEGLLSAQLPAEFEEVARALTKNDKGLFEFLMRPSIGYKQHAETATHYQRMAQFGILLEKGYTPKEAAKIVRQSQFDWMADGIIDSQLLLAMSPFYRSIWMGFKQAGEAVLQPVLHSTEDVAFKLPLKSFMEGVQERQKIGHYAQMYHAAQASQRSNIQDYEDINATEEDKKLMRYLGQRSWPAWAYHYIGTMSANDDEAFPMFRLSPLESLYQLTAWPMLLGFSAMAGSSERFAAQPDLLARMIHPVTGVLGPGFQDVGEVIMNYASGEDAPSESKHFVKDGHVNLLMRAGIPIEEEPPGSGKYHYKSEAAKIFVESLPFIGRQVPNLARAWKRANGETLLPEPDKDAATDILEMFQEIGNATMTFPSYDIAPERDLKKDMFIRKELLRKQLQRAK